MRLLFLIVLAVVAYLLYKLHFQRYLKQGKAGQIKLVLIGLGLVFVALAITGRAPALFAILGAAMTQVMRFAPVLIRYAPSLRRYFGGAAGAAGGFGGASAGDARRSRVTTASLVMTLDHESGDIDGEVLVGEWAGRSLSELTIDEIKALFQYCEQQDPDASRLLQAYVARARSAEWGDADANGNSAGNGDSRGPGQSSKPGVAEAYDILALTPEATRDDVMQAHRSLMRKLHPDKGGSTYLATKVNAAREVLLADIKRRE